MSIVYADVPYADAPASGSSAGRSTPRPSPEDLCKTDVHETPPVFLSLNSGKRTTCRRKARTDCIHAHMVKLLREESVYLYINMKIYRRSTKQIKIAHDEQSNMGSILIGAVNTNEKAKHNPVSTPSHLFRDRNYWMPECACHFRHEPSASP